MLASRSKIENLQNKNYYIIIITNIISSMQIKPCNWLNFFVRLKKLLKFVKNYINKI